jgi:hypothetical protein
VAKAGARFSVFLAYISAILQALWFNKYEMQADEFFGRQRFVLQ